MKKIFLSITTFLLALSLFALPGITSKINDQSGQFVYYKDSSFARESYFGILIYDEGTYAVRYYAPQVMDSYPVLPEKDIQILFTLDITKKYVDLTGERIITPVTPEDTDLINYLHDMIYELTAHRQKAGIVESVITLDQEYDQFGGIVKMTYDPLVPLFNLKTISDKKGIPVLSLVTSGRLTSSEDKHFSSFRGLPLKIEDSHSFTASKKIKKEKITYTKFETHSQKITLDNQWTRNAENMFLLDNVAIIAFDMYKQTPETSQDWNQQIELLKRSFTLGSLGAYPYCELSNHELKKNTEKFTNLIFNNDSKSFTKDFKVLTKMEDGVYAIMTMTVFQGAYSRNSKYFDNILKSYSAN